MVGHTGFEPLTSIK